MAPESHPSMVFERSVNSAKILLGYLRSRITGNPVIWGNPVAVSIEPTTRCNLRCPQCITGRGELQRPGGSISMDLFKSTIDQLLPHLSYLTLYFQGEPFLNCDFTSMVKYARDRHIFVATSTNGHFLDEDTARACVESGLNRIIVSLDGNTQESYAAYRAGGNFEKVTEGIRTLVTARKKAGRKNPRIILQCLVLKSNQDDLRLIRNLGKELGADRVEFKSAQFYDFEPGNPLMPDPGKYSRYRYNGPAGQGLSGKNRLPNHCFRMWSSCVITWDGKVVPCCFDKNADHVLGDLSEQSFSEIWNGEPYRSFRKKLHTGRKSLEICRNCTQWY
jgi:radical SAM protein with 4Fe4S-binding SPASM domain